MIANAEAELSAVIMGEGEDLNEYVKRIQDISDGLRLVYRTSETSGTNDQLRELPQHSLQFEGGECHIMGGVSANSLHYPSIDRHSRCWRPTEGEVQRMEASNDATSWPSRQI